MVAASTPVDLRASYNGSTEVATLTVMPPPPTVTSLRLSPSTVVGGSTSTGTVTLSRVAPPGGVVVAIGSSKPAVAGAPTTVAVAAGQWSASFAISTTAVPAGTSAVISASYNGGAPKTATLTVTLPATSSLTLSPSTVVGGASVSGTVTLSGPAPSAGIVVMLTSSRPSQAAVPRSVTVAAGQRSATFNVTTAPVTADTTAWISGTYRGATKGATLTIKR